MLLVLSVAYDFSFLQAIGLSFQTVPTTIADHVRSAIVWAPGVIAGSLLGLIAGLGTPPHLSPASPPPHSQRVVDMLFFFGVAPSALLFGLLGPASQAVPTLSLIAGMLLFRFQPGAKSVEERLGYGTARLVFGAPALVALVASAGASQGWAFVAASKPTIQVVLKSDSSERTVHATALRRFASVTILAENSSITVLPSDAVLTSSHSKPVDSSLLCKYIEMQCRKP